ncbi:hypothetical protein FGG08_006822 [Glutinoglossum americanum]|uniref:DNA-directed RNA polymerase III subunit RPC9 n=1 Tax=Glutinoglossum americanum TaxID=1670608 RepID=A0A9P8I0H6_9PEZI|nr:hypothetical protein FGG08_006822 [Glutinoglossum americanum]
MKILEMQTAMLSNYEVLTHLEDMRERYDKLAKDRGAAASMKSGNLETLVDYLHTPPSPLQINHAYAKTTISDLISALRPYALEKPEYLMILNLRPATTAELDVVVEEMDQRFKEEEVEAMLRIIGEVLGRPGEGEGSEGVEGGDSNA